MIHIYVMHACIFLLLRQFLESLTSSGFPFWQEVLPHIHRCHHHQRAPYNIRIKCTALFVHSTPWQLVLQRKERAHNNDMLIWDMGIVEEPLSLGGMGLLRTII